MSAEYLRKRTRLKKQWSYIDAALEIVRTNERAEKRKRLFEAINQSDAPTFDQLLNEDRTPIDWPIPSGYNHFNIYQIIIERCTDAFIDHVLTNYAEAIGASTDAGRILVPVACERGEGSIPEVILHVPFVTFSGDESILKLLLKHLPCAPLDGTSECNPSHHYSIHDEPRHWSKRELEAFANELPLASVIRHDRADLLAVLFRFRSFSLDQLSEQQKSQIFYLCLFAEHRQVTVDKFHIKWLRHDSLRPCGSIGCLRLLIETARFNPWDFYDHRTSSLSPFTLVLEPVYLYLIELHHRLVLDATMSLPIRLLRALDDLVHRQMCLFSYLITHCCFQPNESDRIRLRECQHYIEEIFDRKNAYPLVHRSTVNVDRLLVKVTQPYSSLKEICRAMLRHRIRQSRRVLVQVEDTFAQLSSSHRKYLKHLV